MCRTVPPGGTADDGGGRDDRLWAAVAAIVNRRARPKHFDLVLDFAYQRAFRFALGIGITDKQDLDEIAGEASLRLLERMVRDRLDEEASDQV